MPRIELGGNLPPAFAGNNPPALGVVALIDILSADQQAPADCGCNLPLQLGRALNKEASQPWTAIDAGDTETLPPALAGASGSSRAQARRRRRRPGEATPVKARAGGGAGPTDQR